VTGTNSVEEGLAYLDKMTLDGIAEQITCPLLVVHGEHDHLVPLDLAERTVKASVNSPQAELLVFRVEDGGAEHCQMDNISNGTDAIYDWAAEVLRS
jgi:pimeloyl-ACP methyl ester carboxylesterase